MTTDWYEVIEGLRRHMEMHKQLANVIPNRAIIIILILLIISELYLILVKELDKRKDRRMEAKLPKKMTIRKLELLKAFDLEDDDLEFDYDNPELEDYLSDYLSDEVGYCHYGFNWDMDDEFIYVTNIEWDTED